MRTFISIWIVAIFIVTIMVGLITSYEEWASVDRIIPISVMTIPLVLWFGLLAIADAIKGSKPKS